MRRKQWWFVIVVCSGVYLIAICDWWLHRPSPSPAPFGTTEPIASTLPIEPAPEAIPLEEIAQQLADDTTRVAALQQLNKLPYQRINDLRRQARITTDPRANADLNQRAVDLQEQLSANPPPIAIHVQDAALAELIYALNAEMATDLVVSPFRVPLATSNTFTIQETGKPFWEVIFAAADQHSLSFNALRDEMQLSEGTNGGMPYRSIVGPFCIYASVRDNRPIPGARAPATTRPLKWTLRYTLGVDPRLCALAAPLTVTASPDDAGNILLAPNEPFAPHPDTLRGHSFYGEADLTPPAHPGKTIPSLKVEGKILLATSELETVLSFPEVANREISLGDTTFTMQMFTRDAIGRTDGSITYKNLNGQHPYAIFKILDHPDIRVATNIDGYSAFNFPSVPPPAFQLEIKVPRKTVERPVSFEIKNLPLPVLPQ